MKQSINFNLRDFIFSVLSNGKLAFSILLSFLPIDLPSLLSLYIFILFLVIVVRPNLPSINLNVFNRGTTLLIVFFISLIPSLYTPDINTSLAQEKLVLIIYNTIVPIFLIFIFNLYKGETKALLSSILVLSRVTVFACVLGFFFGETSYADDGSRLMVGGIENPIWLSRYLSLAVFSIVYIRRNKLGVFDAILMLIALFFMFQSGSRGPFLALATAIGVLHWNRIGKTRIILFSLIFLAIVAVIATFSTTRILSFNLATDFSALARIDLFFKLFESNSSLFTGYGLGNFGPVILGLDERAYPHNILLELLFETGLLSLTLFFVICFKALTQRFKGIVFYFCLISLINSNFSGDLAGNADLFVFIFVLLAYQSYDKKCIIPKLPRAYREKQYS